jgi:O-antigen/teichoic acid export membrane protein
MTAPPGQSSPDRLGGLRQRYGPAVAGLRGSDTAKAAGLAGAMIANNVVALGSTFVFARLVDDYGALGALISYLLILTVAGQAMQVATAREGVLGHLGVGEDLLATVKNWSKALLVLTALLTLASIALQNPIAHAVGVKKYSWAAAAGIPAGCMFLQVSLLRGALQGIGDYRSVGISLVAEQTVRLISGAILAAAWLGVTGAYLGSLISYIAMSLYCWVQLRSRVADPQRERPARVSLNLWRHVKHAWAAIAGLSVIALLQNIDLISAKHQFTKDTASSYAATAVAAKVLIWVAVGAGFYLVPEVSRRRAAGEDTRPVLVRALGIIAVCAVPCLLIFAGVPHLLLSVAFGKSKATASSSLIVLGGAFTVLAATYLAIQYLLALKRTWFLLPLGLVAIAEPIVLAQAPSHPTGFAAVVLAVQAVAAVVAFALALRAGGRHEPLATPAIEPETVSSSEPGTQPPAPPPPVTV